MASLCHAGLEVVVLGLGLQRDFDEDAPLPVHFEEAGLVARLGDQDPAGVDRLGRVDLGLRALVFEDHLAIRLDLDHAAAGVGVAPGQGEEDVATGQDPPVPGRFGIAPGNDPLAVADIGLGAGGEEAVGDPDQWVVRRAWHAMPIAAASQTTIAIELTRAIDRQELIDRTFAS